MPALKLCKMYLKSHLVINPLGEIADLDTQIDAAESFSALELIALSSKAINMAVPNLAEKYISGYCGINDVVEAECWIRHVRDKMFATNRKLVMCKIDTGGLDGYQMAHKARGEEVYPLLQVTLKVHGYAACTVWLKPKDLERNISTPTLRYLNNRGILEKAKRLGVTTEAATKTLQDYLAKCGVTPNSPENDNTVQMVCSAADMYRAFLSRQLPAVLSYFSPKMIDITPYNALIESVRRYEDMCFARYEVDPVKYVNVLEQFITKISK